MEHVDHRHPHRPQIPRRPCRLSRDLRRRHRAVGSVSERTHHTKKSEVYWRWGVDTMPLMGHGGRVPSGEVTTREEALQAFREAFLKWVNDLHPGDWQRNWDYIKASLVGRG